MRAAAGARLVGSVAVLVNAVAAGFRCSGKHGAYRIIAVNRTAGTAFNSVLVSIPVGTGNLAGWVGSVAVLINAVAAYFGGVRINGGVSIVAVKSGAVAVLIIINGLCRSFTSRPGMR